MEEEYEIPGSTKLLLRGLALFFDVVPLIFLAAAWTTETITAIGQSIGALASVVPLIGWAIGALINSVGIAIGLPVSLGFFIVASCISAMGAPSFFIAFKVNNFPSFQQKQFQWLVIGLGIETIISALPYWSLMVHFAIREEELRRRHAAKKYNKETGGRREQRRQALEEEENDEFAYAA